MSLVNWAGSVSEISPFFPRKNFDVFKRETGLARLSKSLQRKELRGKISEAEPARVTRLI